MNCCTNCGERRLVEEQQPVTREVGDRAFEGLVKGWRCPSCGESYQDGPDLGAFEEAAAKWLAEHGVRTPQELKLMRKAAGIRAADLASWLDVTPETISHWETGKHAPDVVTRSAIASIVLDTLRGESFTRDRLHAQGHPEGTRKVRLGRDAVGGHRTKKDTVNEALEEYIQRRRQAKITDLFGTIEFEPAYDYKRQRRRP